jgi:uncharacterized protein YbjT (DUF2867 family)
VKVVVTGATGNVGTALLRALADESAVESIVGLARRMPRTEFPKSTFAVADVSRDDRRRVLTRSDGPDGRRELADARRRHELLLPRQGRGRVDPGPHRARPPRAAHRWEPRRNAGDVLLELVGSIHDHAGAPTPPLAA